MKKQPTRTLSESAYETLSSMIRSKQLLPGDFVSENSLARELSMSRTPVREAIRRLAQEGAVAVLPSRGVVVSRLTVEDLEEIYAVREVLEGLAARTAAARATPADIEELEVVVAAMAETVSSGDSTSFPDLDVKFHALIAKSGGNGRVVHLLDGMRTANAAAHFRPDFRTQNPRSARSLVEHRDLLRAIQERDPEAAERVARDHARAAVRDILLFALTGEGIT